ncbi:hypothetical protein LDHU3_31.3190:CDS1 [Leishmania donovani]|uniref:Hypothetical_protein n=1 Tax=Leishmania donovani TaxID=5661 RepID=A0A6J8FMW6_LEIDO|nr:hypothetical protein LDHU3_31.3190:CDS1 [Leishmania donovani]VDZ47222.1 hypothetical_protein [Leishmania donovani]
MAHKPQRPLAAAIKHPDSSQSVPKATLSSCSSCPALQLTARRCAGEIAYMDPRSAWIRRDGLARRIYFALPGACVFGGQRALCELFARALACDTSPAMAAAALREGAARASEGWRRSVL